MCCFGVLSLSVDSFPWLSKFTFGACSNCKPSRFRLPCLFYSTISHRGCSFLSHNELHMHVHQSLWPMNKHWSSTAKPPPQHCGQEVGEIYCIGFRNWLWFVGMEVGVSLAGQRETCGRLRRWIIICSRIRQGRFICK